MSEPMMMTIRCPRCDHTDHVAVPDDQCVLVHDCAGCGAELRRHPGACCVFCSHPDDPVPKAPSESPPTSAGCGC
ncbi:MAG: GDCCVxC domain-containing (seleno)protein [Pseudomonadota bacterium]